MSTHNTHAAILRTRSREQLINHLATFHGAVTTGEDDVTTWTTKEMRDMHRDDHNRQSAYIKPARMTPHLH